MDIKQLSPIMTDAWAFLKKYAAGSVSEDCRAEAFCEIQLLMKKHEAMKNTPRGSFAYEVLQACYDLIDRISEGEASCPKKC